MDQQPALINYLPSKESNGVKPISYQGLLSLIKEAIMILGSDATILYMNQKADDIFHRLYNTRYSESCSLFDLLPQPRHDVIAAILKRCWLGESLDYDTQVMRGAQSFWINCRYMPLYEDGTVCCISVVIDDIKSKKELEREECKLREAERQIIRSIIEAQEKERRELSLELHDNVNQILSSCQLMLEVARDKKDLSQRLTEKAYESLKTAISEVRKISHELNPSAIEDFGLSEAISEMADKINSAGKLRIYFNYREYGRNPTFAMTDKIAVYRIVQEQLNNIIKHAQASEVHITLYYKLARLYLNIEDDGIGFDIKQVKKGLGLKNIQHRVAYYQGRLKIDTAQGRGCKLKVLLSIPA